MNPKIIHFSKPINYLFQKDKILNFQSFTRSIFFLLLLLTLNQIGFTQANCGEAPPNTANTTDPALMYYDRWGNSYDIASQSSMPVSTTVELSSFILSFSDEFDQDEIDVCREVFNYLETIIEKRTQVTECGVTVNSPKADIMIIKDGDDPLSSGTLATGTPFFKNQTFTPFPSNASGCNNEGRYLSFPTIFEKFSGLNNIYEGFEYDGLIKINNNFDFFTDYPNDPVGSGKYDMFSTVLHEAMHILAFHPIFNDNPINNNIPIRPYDLLCMDNQGEHFLTNNCSDICYTSSYNPMQAAFCGGLIGENQLPAVNNIDFAHLGDGSQGCGTNLYVMTQMFNLEERKLLTNDEINILCEVGYKLTNGCDGKYGIPVNKRPARQTPIICSEYEFCCPNEFRSCELSITIPKADLLCFAHQNLPNPEISEIKHGHGNNLTVTDNPNEIIFTASEYNELDRIIVGINYNHPNGNCWTTHRNIKIQFDPTCIDCNNTSYNACTDLLCFNEFDEIVTFGELHDDDLSFGHSYVFDNQCHNTPDLKSDAGDPDNKYLEMFHGESITIEIADGIHNSCDLKFSFDGRSNPTSGLNEKVLLWGSINPPCDINDVAIPFKCEETIQCENYNFNPKCIGEILIPNEVNFMPHEYIFNIDEELEDIRYLIITTQSEDGEGYIHYDNINLEIETCAKDASFDYEIFTCNFVQFTPLFPNDKQTHIWDFGEGPPSTLENGYHNYSAPGTYTVSHTIEDHCGNTDVSYQTVVILDCSSACPDYVFVGDAPLKCSEEDPNMAPFSIQVEEGATFCNGSVEFSGGSITNPYILSNILYGSATLDDPDGIYHITLCDANGDELCYLIGFDIPKVCDKCTDLPASDMECDDQDLTDDITHYFTNITIPLSGAYISPCGISASHPNLEYSNFSPFAGGVSFDLNLTSSTDIDISNGFTANICIATNTPQNECFNLFINIPEPCVVSCDNVYDDPNLPTYECNFVDPVTGLAEIPIGPIFLSSVAPLKNPGWEICDGVIGSVPGGQILFDYSQYTPSGLGSQTATILLVLGIPCTLLEDGPIETTISLNICGPNDDIECFDLVVTIGCPECEAAKRSSLIEQNEFSFFPNPALNNVTIVSKSEILPYSLELYNQTGQLILIEQILKKEQVVDISNINKGLYFLRPKHTYSKLNMKKLIIID